MLWFLPFLALLAEALGAIAEEEALGAIEEEIARLTLGIAELAGTIEADWLARALLYLAGC